MPFEVIKKIEDGPIVFLTKEYSDERGYFFEAYQKKALETLGLCDNFVQDNVSYSVKDVLRGMHYQLNPCAQAKFVMALRGELFDVVVDVRKNRPTYGKCYENIISDKNRYVLYVPVGFAHGFIVRSDEAVVLYKTNNDYSPENDAGFIWNDKDLNINWGTKNPIMSEKDRNLPSFSEAKNNFD